LWSHLVTKHFFINRSFVDIYLIDLL
jgi:hypothetical protein